MEDSKKAIVVMGIIWATLLIYVNFIHVERLPYWWLDYHGTRYVTSSNILIGIVVVLSIIILFPNLKSKIKEMM